jgi:hypothetical protein
VVPAILFYTFYPTKKYDLHQHYVGIPNVRSYLHVASPLLGAMPLVALISKPIAHVRQILSLRHICAWSMCIHTAWANRRSPCLEAGIEYNTQSDSGKDLP